MTETVGVYISVPFCKAKCTFCNFASGAFGSERMQHYVNRLCEEIGGARDAADAITAILPRAVDTIYFGGGTPSLLSAQQFRRIFDHLRSEFDVAAEAEITLECAPGQLTDETLDELIRQGINRISFGVQSFNDAEAKHTGRLHTREVALRDIDRVRQAGVSRINIDLIAGLPGQTRASWTESLRVLADTGVDHASIYMLEVDEGSRLGREVASGGLKYYAPQVPPDEIIADMYSEAVEFLAAHGLAQYEISNFAQGGRESLHNLKYWCRELYVGLGLDAHSMIRTDRGLRAHSGAALRFAATDELESYLASPEWNKPHRLSHEEELEEAWFLGLRLNCGVNLRDLGAEFGTAAVESVHPILTDLECNDLIKWTADHVALTPRGRLISNEVFERFLALTTT